MDKRQTQSWAYMLAVLLPVLTLSLNVTCAYFVGDAAIYILHFIPLVVVCWIGGIGPSLVSIATSLVLVNLMLLHPFHGVQINGISARHHYIFRSVLFVLVSGAITAMGAWARRKSLAEAQMKREVQRQLAGAQERELRHRVILDNVGDYAILMLDPNGIIISWNQGAERIKGYAPEEIVGRPFRCLFPEAEQAKGRPEEILNRVKATGHWRSEEVRRRKDGTHFVANVTLTSLVTDDGKLIGFVEIAGDVTERRRYENDLRSALDYNEAITNSAGEAIFRLDELGAIRFANPAAERMFQYDQNELLGLKLYDIFLHHHADGTPFAERDCPLNCVIRTGKPVANCEAYFIAKHDRFVAVLASNSPIRAANGEIVGTVMVVHDMTARKKFETDLRQAKEEAEAASRAKDNFIAVLSHELRTPLTPVLAGIDGIARFRRVEDSLLPEIAMIRRNVELEISLIDDLLDVTRISRGKLILHKRDVYFHDLVRNVKQIVADDVTKKKLSLILELEARNCHVRGDPARLQQVLWNLVKNAIRFTSNEGTITVRTENDGDDLRVSVQDSGQGIDRQMLPKLFIPFEQGDRLAGSTGGGLGLGLSIAKSLTEMQGGRIEAYSEGRYRGSTFSVTLPTLKTPFPEIEVKPIATSSHKSGARILLVEDHEDTRESMRRLLKFEGYVVSTATTVNDAVRALDGQKFDLLISDIGLPDGTGHELMQQVIAKHKGIKAIALTGFGQEDDVQRSLASGFDAHLTKPVNLDVLTNVIDKTLDART